MGHLASYVLLFLIVTKSVITNKNLHEERSETKVKCYIKTIRVGNLKLYGNN